MDLDKSSLLKNSVRWKDPSLSNQRLKVMGHTEELLLEILMFNLIHKDLEKPDKPVEIIVYI